MPDRHKVQLDILKKLLFSDSRRYAQIKPKEMEGSQFTFHLDQLSAQKLIYKTKTGEYSLTSSGKEYANRMHTDEAALKHQAKLSMILCAKKRTPQGLEYLLYRRLKNPFYGHIGFPTHKVWFGEKLAEAANAALIAECGLAGEGKLVGIRHYHVKSDDTLYEDKVFFIFEFEPTEGAITHNRDGEYFWVPAEKIDEVAQPHLPELPDVIALLNGKSPYFLETDQYVDNF